MKPQDSRKEAPQCETAAQCLHELARVMEQFDISYIKGAVVSDYVKYMGVFSRVDELSRFSQPTQWKFAIAEAEGKPVFIGDKLYTCNNSMVEIIDYCTVTKRFLDTHDHWHSDLSWNPPKPKTVMVEMLVEDVQKLIIPFDLPCPSWHSRLSTACRKALEELK